MSIRIKNQNTKFRQNSQISTKTQFNNIKKTDHSIQNSEIIKAIKFIHMNYKEPITLNDIANASCINKYSLCRVFKRIIGTTCFNYLNEVRINEAKKLLQDNRFETITKVTFYVGFNNMTHFDRVFKKLVGISPVQYKKMHKNGDLQQKINL
jgi:YesN/AraC family two-component response regulator